MIYHKIQKIQADGLDFLFRLRPHIEKSAKICYNKLNEKLSKLIFKSLQ